MVVKRAYKVNRKLSFCILFKWNLLRIDKQVHLFNENQSKTKTHLQKIYDWQYHFSSVLLIFKWNFNDPRFINLTIQREEALCEETGHLRECEKWYVASMKAEWQKCEKNSPADTKGQGEEVPDVTTEIPLQPVEKTIVIQV